MRTTSTGPGGGRWVRRISRVGMDGAAAAEVTAADTAAVATTRRREGSEISASSSRRVTRSQTMSSLTSGTKTRTMKPRSNSSTCARRGDRRWTDRCRSRRSAECERARGFQMRCDISRGQPTSFARSLDPPCPDPPTNTLSSASPRYPIVHIFVASLVQSLFTERRS